MTASRAEPFEIGGESVAPGGRLRLDLPAMLLPTHTRLNLPLVVAHGRRPGPCMWVSAAVHGNELNGVEIIREVLARLPDPLPRGTLLAVPIVNVFGFIGQSRYLPDRRDMNRCFPGSTKGSLASRMARLFLDEIVSRCSHGIDCHTAGQDRDNLPQVRANLDDPATLEVARACRAPVMINSTERDGSLRAAAAEQGAVTLLYEGGEPLRFNREAIDAGVAGVLGVMRHLGMISSGVPRRAGAGPRAATNLRIEKSSWVRARRGGLVRLAVGLGERVTADQVLGHVADPFGEDRTDLRAPFDGLVIGCQHNPVVHGGDAVVHVGRIDEPAG